MTTPQPVESIFARSWTLLNRNWIIVVPGLVIGLIAGVLTSLLVPQSSYDSTSTAVTGTLAGTTGRLAAGIVALLAYIATQAYTTGMAGAAWERGTTTFADGAASFQEDAGRIVVTAIGLILLGVAAAVLAVPTLGLSVLAFFIFTLYAMPAAIVGNRDGFSSIRESFTIVRHRFSTTLIIAIVLFVVFVVVTFIAAIFSYIPYLGPVITACIEQAVVAFAVLVLVGEYLDARGTGDATELP